MLLYTVFIPFHVQTQHRGFSFKSKHDAMLEAVIINFDYMYDLSNILFPKGIIDKHVSLDWYDSCTLNTYEQLNDLTTGQLETILKCQECILSDPECDKLYATVIPEILVDDSDLKPPRLERSGYSNVVLHQQRPFPI